MSELEDERLHPALARLLGVLELDSRGEAIWEGGHPNSLAQHLFGGQVLAQGLVAAHRESGEVLCHSLHANFLKRGTTQESIRFEVTQLRRSRTFGTYQVVASQSVGPILHMTVSYHDAEVGPVHQIPMDEVGPPQGEAYERALLQVMTPGSGVDEAAFELPIEIRSVGDLGLFSSEVNPPNARAWMRVRGHLPDDPVLQQCLFAYASDYAIFIPALNPHPAPVTAFQSASPRRRGPWASRLASSRPRADRWVLAASGPPG